MFIWIQNFIDFTWFIMKFHHPDYNEICFKLDSHIKADYGQFSEADIVTARMF